jgi:hypothetical protein
VHKRFESHSNNELGSVFEFVGMARIVYLIETLRFRNRILLDSLSRRETGFKFQDGDFHFRYPIQTQRAERGLQRRLTAHVLPESRGILVPLHSFYQLHKVDPPATLPLHSIDYAPEFKTSRLHFIFLIILTSTLTWSWKDQLHVDNFKDESILYQDPNSLPQARI